MPSSNPNNCETCHYKQIHHEGDGTHCYMFREEPTEVCRAHSVRTGFIIDTATLLRRIGYLKS